MSADTEVHRAQAYLREQFGEGWEFVDDLSFSHNYTHRWWAKREGVRVYGDGTDPMSAAKACVEAWREATKEVRRMDNLAGWDTANHEGMRLLAAERTHADRLAEALKVARNKLAQGFVRVGAVAEDLNVAADEANEALAAHDARREGSGGRAGR